jgi:branched-chain amino acid transport system substrate-binding protein
MNTNTLSIGLLLPNSTILPMSRDFERGMKSALRELSEQQGWEIEIIPEFIAEGSREKADSAINKLVSYHDVNIISGILSNRTINGLSEKLEKSKKPFLFNNIGEHVPDPSLFAEGIYVNSIHTWQQIWSMGHWAASNFGPRGMFLSGIYDAGYSFSSMLNLGMMAADPQAEMPFAIAPVASPGSLADVKSVFQYIDQFSPDFLFATFCGEEAKIFLDEYIRLGYHQRLPLLGLPYLLQPVDNTEQFVVYTSVCVGEDVETPDVQKILENMNNPFSMLGYESGTLIKKALKGSAIKDLKESLQGIDIASSRGKITIQKGHSGEASKVYLVKNTIQGENSKTEILDELKTTSFQDAALLETINLPSSGWYNPYPAV